MYVKVTAVVPFTLYLSCISNCMEFDVFNRHCVFKSYMCAHVHDGTCMLCTHTPKLPSTHESSSQYILALESARRAVDILRVYRGASHQDCVELSEMINLLTIQ